MVQRWFRDGSVMAPAQFVRKTQLFRSLQELMLHETAVSWPRVAERRALPKKPWEETVEAFHTRLKKACCNVNTSCDVEGLCRQLPERIETLHKKKGDRLRK